MEIKQFQNKIKDLPTISAVASQINQAVKNESLTAGALGEIISRDPSLTTKVLRLANSAYYGLPREVSQLNRAITILGMDTIKNLALTVSVFRAFCCANNPGLSVNLKGLWYHSLGTAVAAKAILSQNDALQRDEALAEQAFLCGIIHDVGKIAITQNLPNEMAEVLTRMHEAKIPQYEAEKEIIGFSHQRAGQALADAWNFPEEYLKVIRQHHAPTLTASIPPKTAQLIMAVYIGNKMAKAMQLGTSTDPLAAKVTPEDLHQAGITSNDLPGIITVTKASYTTLLSQWTYESC
ncbi:MAG: HDOD domain-containing protein [Thermodesulfobacteriota bacterium]